MSHTRPAPAAMPPPQPPLPPKGTVLTGPNGPISAPPTEKNRYAAGPTRSPRNQAKNRVTLGDQRPVGSSARVPAQWLAVRRWRDRLSHVLSWLLRPWAVLALGQVLACLAHRC